MIKTALTLRAENLDALSADNKKAKKSLLCAREDIPAPHFLELELILSQIAQKPVLRG